jgi:DASS family divalent anion:Na+ symporter
MWILPRPATVDPRAWQLLAIFVATVVGIIAKPIPMGAMAIAGIAAALATRTLTLAEALSGFANATVWLVVAAFCFATGFIKTGLGIRIAYHLITLFGRSPLGLGYSLVMSDFMLASAVPSNAARAGGVMAPILRSICKTAIEEDPVRGRQTSAFLTAMAYQGTVVTTAVLVTGSVANLLALEFAAAQGVAITWSGWAQAAIVPGLVSYAVVPFIVRLLCPPGVFKTPEAPSAARAALARMGPMKRGEWLMGLVSLGVLTAWVLGTRLGLDNTASALIAIAALLVTGVLTWDDVIGEHETWNTLVWFATLVMMATFLGNLGLIKWFSAEVGAAFGGVGWLTGFIGLCVTYYYVHYFFASNTAHVSAMYAPFLAVALALGSPPIVAALVFGYLNGLSAAVTHYGNASAPILFGGGHVPLATWWKVGGVVSVANLAIWLTVGSVWWRMLGLW